MSISFSPFAFEILLERGESDIIAFSKHGELHRFAQQACTFSNCRYSISQMYDVRINQSASYESSAICS